MLEIKSKEEYNDLIANNKIIVVDFYNDYCAPCELLEKELKAIENAVVGRVNIINLLGLAKELDVTKIPSMLIYSNGKIAMKISGYRNQKYIQSVIDKLILTE